MICHCKKIQNSRFFKGNVTPCQGGCMQDWAGSETLPGFKLKFLSFHSTKLSFQGEFWIAHNLRISKLTKILRFDAEKPGEKCLKEKIGFCMPGLYSTPFKTDARKCALMSESKLMTNDIDTRYFNYTLQSVDCMSLYWCCLIFLCHGPMFSLQFPMVCAGL